MRGIYKITNKINGKVYIGESLDILRRWREHKETLEDNKHSNYKLQEEYNKYGIDNFEFNIVSVLNDDISHFSDKYILLVYEYYYILKYNSIKSGYNIEPTAKEVIKGNKCINGKFDKKILEDYKNKVDEGFIKEIGGIIFCDNYSLKHIEKKLKISRDKMKEALRYHDILITVDGKKQLNESKITEGIEVNGSYAKVRIDNKLCEYLTSLIIDYLENESDYIKTKKEKHKSESKPETTKQKKDKKVQKEAIYENIDINNYIIATEESTYKTFKEFVGDYQLKLTYNKFFKYLRDNNIIEYRMIDNKKYNVPCNQYIDIIHIRINQLNDSDTYSVRMVLTKEGESFMYKFY